MSKKDMLEQNSASRLRTLREVKMDIRGLIDLVDGRMSEYFTPPPIGVYGPNSHLPLITPDQWVIRRFHSIQTGPRELTELIRMDQVYEEKDCDVFVFTGRELDQNYRVEKTSNGIFLYSLQRQTKEKLVLPRTWMTSARKVFGPSNILLPYRATEFTLFLLRSFTEDVLTVPNGFNAEQVSEHLSPHYNADQVIQAGKELLDAYFQQFHGKKTVSFLEDIVDKFYTHNFSFTVHSGFVSICMGIDWYALEYFKQKDYEEAQSE